MNQFKFKNGYIFTESLGMIADPNGVLELLPYADVQDFVRVAVKVTLNEPALFNIVKVIDQDILTKFKNIETQATGLLVNYKTGKIYSSNFPSLDLRIAQKDISRFKLGQFVTGIFKASPEVSSHTYISKNVQLVDTEPNRCLEIRNDYALVSFILKLIYFYVVT